mgnify:CR=1 FL=1
MSGRTPNLKPSEAARFAEMERRLTDLEARTRSMPARVVNPSVGSTMTMIQQTAHGFSAKDVVRHNGTSWTKSQADTAANAIVGGIVLSVPSPDIFILATAGRVAGLSGLTSGSLHYLSSSTAGALTTTAPNLAVAVLLADSTTSGIIIPHIEQNDYFDAKTIYTANGTFTSGRNGRIFGIVIGGGSSGSNFGITESTLGYIAPTSGGSPTVPLYYSVNGSAGSSGSAAFFEIDAYSGEAFSIVVGAAAAASSVINSSGTLVSVVANAIGTGASIVGCPEIDIDMARRPIFSANPCIRGPKASARTSTMIGESQNAGPRGYTFFNYSNRGGAGNSAASDGTGLTSGVDGIVIIFYKA